MEKQETGNEALDAPIPLNTFLGYFHSSEPSPPKLGLDPRLSATFSTASPRTNHHVPPFLRGDSALASCSFQSGSRPPTRARPRWKVRHRVLRCIPGLAAGRWGCLCSVGAQKTPEAPRRRRTCRASPHPESACAQRAPGPAASDASAAVAIWSSAGSGGWGRDRPTRAVGGLQRGSAPGSPWVEGLTP